MPPREPKPTIRRRNNKPHHHTPKSRESQEQALTEWLLQMHDDGTELSAIQKMSPLSNQKTKERLQSALDAASGENPTGLIIHGPDGKPGRVSWVDNDGNLIHRPFDGAFPPNYLQDLAIQQCQDVFLRLLEVANEPARNRAYTMLMMAEAGLQSFGYQEGRGLNAVLEKAGMDEDTKRTVILELHHDHAVGKLLLQRCGIKERWLAGNAARFLSRRMREHEYTPALIRNVLEYMGNDPDPTT